MLDWGSFAICRCKRGVGDILRAGKQLGQTMRQTVAHRSYVRSRAVLSRHGPSPTCRSKIHRSGFTLIEVVVAVAILLIVSVAFLQFSITSYQWGTNLVVRSMAQNLAELTAEQIAGASVLQIQSMITNPSSSATPDFPTNGTTWPSDLNPSNISIVTPSVGTYSVTMPGEFLVTGITSFFPTPSSLLPNGKPSPSGDISALDSLATGFTKRFGTGDLTTTFPSLSATVASNYSTWLYEATSNIAVVPIMMKSSGSYEDSSLVLFRGQFPRFLRKISITRIDGGAANKLSLALYKYTVQVTWTLNGTKQLVVVSGERSSVY